MYSVVLEISAPSIVSLYFNDLQRSAALGMFFPQTQRRKTMSLPLKKTFRRRGSRRFVLPFTMALALVFGTMTMIAGS